MSIARVRNVLAYWATALAAVAAPAAEPDPAGVAFFETHIRPILVDACYSCHSTEANKSKGGLKLDTRAAVAQGGESGPVLTAGNPDASLLIKAVRYTDEDLQMPPPDKGKKLSAEQVALLETWVRMGAPDPRVGGQAHPLDFAAARRHWAFQPVVKPALPPVKDPRWVRTPVDAFIGAKLEAKGLRPAVPADAHTLLRRVTYDLTGLPPTPAEREAFVTEAQKDFEAAYARVVERLLASPRYGERWGRFWLDVARYADTRGYLAGNAERRYAFSHTYRDYVIGAFNDDKPFDRFIVEQLAADRVVEGEDRAALAALGFVTLGRRFLNNQNDIIDDRIDLVGRGLMGLTVSCARCHDHKFDPVSMQDYYALHGVFASSEEPAELPLLGPLRDSEEYRAFLAKKAVAEEKVKERARSEVEKFIDAQRVKTGDYLLAVHEWKPGDGKQTLELYAGTRKLEPQVLRRYQAWLPQHGSEDDPVLGPWRRFAALPAGEFAAQAERLLAAWRAEGAAAARWNAEVVRALLTAKEPIVSLKDVAAAYNRAFASAEKVAKPAAMAEGKGTAKGKAKAKGASAAKAEEKSEPDVPGDPAAQRALREFSRLADAPVNLAYDAAAAIIKRQIDDRTSGLRREVEALNWTERGAPLRAMALVDKPAPRNSVVFLRGNPANRGPEAPRRFLSVLSAGEPKPFKEGSGRLELARAIASPDNPLTARVFVNRVWGWHFGAALVRTPSDFGVRTEAPVQRELLDWLAASFVEEGWSVKRLHRWIVLSNAYRQSSEARPESAQADPENQFVHRFNRRRLEMEALRDSLLATSGALDLRAGGLPDDMNQEPFATRRTVYGFIDRQELPGFFRTFDYPNPDVSTAQRLNTTVPQQALFLMNAPFVQEQARRLAARTEVTAAVSDADKVRALYRLTLQREPDADELALARTFASQPPAAAPVARVSGWQYGEGRCDEKTGRVVEFREFKERKEGRAQPGAVFPDPTLGHVFVNATGGHPGHTAAHAAIRRWIAPESGTVRVAGMLGHASDKGDGVRGLVVSSRAGRLGEWRVANGKAETAVADLAVEAGDTLDFVVEPGTDANSDAFTWAPEVAFTPGAGEMKGPTRTYASKKDFDRPARQVLPMSRWDELAQVLLMANEMAFID